MPVALADVMQEGCGDENVGALHVRGRLDDVMGSRSWRHGEGLQGHLCAIDEVRVHGVFVVEVPLDQPRDCRKLREEALKETQLMQCLQVGWPPFGIGEDSHEELHRFGAAGDPWGEAQGDGSGDLHASLRSDALVVALGNSNDAQQL